MAKDSYEIDNEKGDRKKLPYPKSILFIIGNEFCERFSFYGMRTILVLYFRYVLLFDENLATQIYHIFVMACYFTPVFGAIIADSYLGKYWTILSISCLYAAGNIIISGASITGTIWISFIGLTLIAIGTGGIKPCVAAFGGDQFQSGQEKQLQQFFSYFYIAINSGSLVSTFLTPILRQDITCFGRSDCYPLAFGVPAILMVVAVILFVMGKFITDYTIVPPAKDNVVCRVFSCIGRALSRRFFLSDSTKKKHWIDYADDKYDKKTRNDVKALLRVLFLYLPLPVFWALFDQQASRWTLQAIRMNGQLGSYFTVKPDQIQVINPFLVIFFVPLFDHIIYPIFKKIGLYTPLKRIVLGAILAAISFGVCGFFQLSIEAEAPVAMKNGHNHLAIVNNGGENLSFLNQTISPNEIKVIDNVERSILKSQFDITGNLSDGKTLAVYYYNDQNNNNKTLSLNFIWNNILKKPDSSGAKLFTIFDLKNFNEEKFKIIGHKNDLIINKIIDENGRKIGYLDSFEVDIIGKDIEMKIGKNLTMIYDKMGQGSAYIQVISGDVNNDPESKLFQIVDENKLSVFLQLIQYVIMTAGEILFSITGLEFSYSQAPQSMKSVLQASWLLTVAFGNLIVAIITEFKFEHQSNEFFFFFILMLIDALIFAIMAYFYKPYKGDDHDIDDTDTDDDKSSDRQQLDKANVDGDGDTLTLSTRRQSSNENLSMKPITNKNNSS